MKNSEERGLRRRRGCTVIRSHISAIKRKTEGRSQRSGERVYGKVQKLRESLSDDVSVHILLQGCVEPDLKDSALKERYGGATPAETVKAMLLPGEIEDLSRAVEKLCGYRRTTIDEVKNA